MKSLLIRAEDKNKWERRSPIVPDDLKNIINDTGVEAFVEESEKRFFPLKDYEAYGAKRCTGMEKGDVIFGVKEIPEEKIIKDKVYIFFSHTIKGQKSGMPLLKKIIKSGSTLIDYEKITDEKKRRLIYFGRYAGDAGTIDILWLMGEYWQNLGINTPFSKCRQALEYQSVADATEQISKIGEDIKNNGLPKELCPMVFGITGYGNVSGGAQHILNCLPVEIIKPENLEAFVKSGKYDSKKVYVTIFKEIDIVEHKQGKVFDLDEYYQKPENFISKFEQYLPYMNVLINAVYWEKRYPRFVTWDGLKRLYEKEKTPKFCGIADISCDVNGAVECTVKSTDSGMPAFLCDPVTKNTTDGHKGKGVVVLGIDNLPCELPHDSSTFFSDKLKGFVSDILQADYKTSLEESGLCPEVKKAVIVYNGKLTKSYEYLNKYL